MYSMSIPPGLKGTSRHVSRGQTNLIGGDVLLRLRPGRPTASGGCLLRFDLPHSSEGRKLFRFVFFAECGFFFHFFFKYHAVLQARPN